MFYREDYRPRLADYDRRGRLSYEAILQILETAGSHHSDTVNDSVIAGSQSGIAWILADWHVRIQKRPESGDELHIATWVRGKARAGAILRGFLVTDKSGNEMLRAEARTALYDTERGRPTRISEALFAAYGPEDEAVFEEGAVRLRPLEHYRRAMPLILRRSDIDYNNHVHNTRYMGFALEALPPEAYERDELKELRIAYLKPVKAGDAVTLKYSPVENTHAVAVFAGATPCALMEFA